MAEFPVNFGGAVASELTSHPGLVERLSDELNVVFAEFSKERTPLQAHVPRQFAGFTADAWERIVLAVEVTYKDGYERHIVKLGKRFKIEEDEVGWRSCTHDRHVASRILAPVRGFELPDLTDSNRGEVQARYAVLYRDAYSLFGPEGDARSAPTSLENAIRSAVRLGEPDTVSAERAIAHIFMDLGSWFYRGAAVRPDAAYAFYLKQLRPRSSAPRSQGVLDFWKTDPDRRNLRRQAIWAVASKDKPSDLRAKYLDPIEYVDWMMSRPDGSRLPTALVGRSHGDLHARNVLVGCRRGEIEYPAVYDYGDMSPDNVLAWDFAKLETELKVRLLPDLIDDRDDPSARNFLHAESGSRANATVDHMAMFLVFETILREAAESVDREGDVERLTPAHPWTNVARLDRLLAILLRIRKEGAYWLGMRPSSDQRHRWQDDLNIALAIYGLVNVRWGYPRREREAALISAGAAVAALRGMPKRLEQEADDWPKNGETWSSYRVPLRKIVSLWTRKQHDEGIALVAAHVFEGDGGGRLKIRNDVAHAVPLINYAALMALESGSHLAVQGVLDSLQEEAERYADEETLARMARTHKDMGDQALEELIRNWDGVAPPPWIEEEPTVQPSWKQRYLKACELYGLAFELTEKYYVGVNAATCALLAGDSRAKEYARRARAGCALLGHSLEEQYWQFASEGEIRLVLGECGRDAYSNAIKLLKGDQLGFADASYKQICRLWRHYHDRGGRHVDAALELFETHPDFGPHLTRVAGRPR